MKFEIKLFSKVDPADMIHFGRISSQKLTSTFTWVLRNQRYNDLLWYTMVLQKEHVLNMFSGHKPFHFFFIKHWDIREKTILSFLDLFWT